MKSRLLLSIAALVLAAIPAVAQTGLATVTGTVTDQTGAVIPNVPIQAKHVATGTNLTAITSDTGSYTITQMPIGAYEFTITHSGFKNYVRNGVSLAAQQTLRLDIQMEIGSAAESVTVSADASLLKTESGSITHNVTVSQMQNLPLLPVNGNTGNSSSSGFRDPFAVALLIPGVQYGASSSMVVNGMPTTSVQFRVEGQTAGNTGGLAQFTHQTQPSVDAIQEVAIQTNSFAAEFGTVGGAIFNVTMKSGTNQYHGSIYDYAVNEVLNAAHPYTHLKNRERRHDFGGTIGGPINIPKIYNGTNKTFFFFSIEQFRNSSVVVSSTPTVPTALYRVGNFSLLPAASGTGGTPVTLQVGTGTAARNYLDPFGNSILSGTLFDHKSTQTVACPANNPDCPVGTSKDFRTALPNNTIPTTYFDQVALNIQKLVPLPKGPNNDRGQFGANYQNPWNSSRLSMIPSIKLDQNIGKAGRLNFYWGRTSTESQYAFPNGAAEGFPSPITAARGTFIYAPTYRINYDHTLTPTMLLHIGVGWSQNNFADRAPEINYNPEKELGLKGATVNRNFPNINPCGGLGCAATTGGLSTLGPSGGIQSSSGSERRPSATVNLNWVKRNHSIKFGAEWRQDRYPVNVFTNSAGSYGFSGSGYTAQTALQGITLSRGSTGFGYAQFLEGNVRSLTLATPAIYRTSKHQWGLFLQDTWKATRKLTVDYGVRWDYGTYTKEDYGRNGNLNLLVPNASAGGHPGGLIFEAQCKCKFANNYPYAIGPRVGFAYNLNPKTVFRGGMGLVYQATGTFGGSVTNDVDGGTPGFGDGIFLLRDGVPSTIVPRWPVYSADIGHTPNTVLTGTAIPQRLDPNAGRPGRTLQWNLAIQREINRNLVIEAAYVANRAVWTGGAGLTTVNDITPAYLSKFGFTVGNTDDRTLLITQWGNLTTAQRSTLQQRGVNIPYTGFPTNQTVRQSMRPFPQYNGSLSPAAAPLGRIWYDSLQITLTKRYSHGLTFNGNYTFSKQLSLTSSPDVFNRSLGKNLGDNDLPHQFRISAEYQTPRIAPAIPVLGNRYISYALSGWGLGIYAQYQSASQLSRPANGAAQPISDWLGRGPGDAQLKVDPTTGKPMSPWSVNWTDYSGKVHTDPIDINCKCYDPAKTIVLNPAAWESPANGQWANSFSDIRYYRGIRRPQESANFSRNFRFGKDNRMTLQVRVEVNNVFNRMLLPNPTTLNTTSFINPPTVVSGVYTGGFGTYGNITGGTGLGAQRSGLLVGRLQF